jgi:hypothetical protein
VGSGIYGAYRAIQGIWHQMTVQNQGLLPTTGIYGHHAAYDPTADSMIVYGGVDSAFTLQTSTWEMTLSGARNAAANTESWTTINTGGGVNDPPGTAVAVYEYFHDGTNPMVVLNNGYIGTPTTYTSATYFFNLSTNSWSIPTITGSGPTGTGGGREGMTGIVDTSGSTPRLVTFSGYDSTPTYYNDVYTLTLTGTRQWTAQTLTSAPTARFYSASVFDNSGTTARMLAFGGNPSSGVSLQDAPSLSLGSTMSWSTITAPQGSRSHHTAVIDTTVNSVILFGGWNSSNGYNSIEVYELTSGSSIWSWTQTWTTGAPAPRHFTAAVWDQNTHRMILIGGHNRGSSLYYADVWELY